MNDIKVNKPSDIVLKLGEKYFIQFESGSWYEGELIEIWPNNRAYVATFKTNWGEYSLDKEEIKTRMKNIGSIDEIRRLQQLAGINEIKIKNPIISKEDIVNLYNKIDYFIGRFWRYDDEPAQDGYIAGLDEELDKIMAEYDYRFETGYNDIRAYLSKNQNKNNILYHKLKELDSKINYNYTPQ